MKFRTFKVVKQYYFLAPGTMLKEDINGNYFVSMSDDDRLASRLHFNVTIEGRVVENPLDAFEEIK